MHPSGALKAGSAARPGSGQVEIAGRYLLRGTLGTGAGTVVHEAFDRLIERRVALKLVSLPAVEDAETAEAIARFRRGARAAGGLNHPNIVAVFDYGENAEQAWIVMELVEGGSLKALLDAGEKLPLPKILALMTQLLEGLGYSHARGVVHRDIKPANLMLTPAGMLKIADFGIARLENSSITQIGTMMGTPAYMAPEQLRGETVDARADIWAAGVVLYQMLTGEKPFGGGITSIMQKVLNTDPVPPSRHGTPTGSPEIDAVVARAMAKLPEDRFASAAEFAAALQRAVAAAAAGGTAAPRHPTEDGTVVSAPPRRRLPPEPSRGRRLLLPALGGGVVILALLIGGSMMLGSRRPTPPPAQQAAAVPPPPPAPAPIAAQPAPVAMPAPPPTPAAPPPVPPSLAPPEPDLAALAATIREEPCSLLRVAVTGREIAVGGLARTASVEAVRRSLDGAGLAPGAARLALDNFDAPYCATLDAVRPVAVLGEEAPNLRFTSPNPLRGGQALRFSVTTPDWPARLHIAYVTEAGEVGHLVQGGVPQAPRSAVAFGDGNRWAATAPFGADMLVVIATERPLFMLRRRGERIEDFNIALTGALRDAQQEGGRAAVRVVLLHTVPGP
ncbi:protein kinase [Belnapia sp. T6]|uniref:Protein kinase n=1 Tax=Belnapia mucosa TaxID=2804532 RepID=A0ABS1UW21_9PROT|nr:serine/threonine-protein kinase [Belnapia mucosa]MBL6453684.1 protein kinase [Belnapia mucosa]